MNAPPPGRDMLCDLATAKPDSRPPGTGPASTVQEAWTRLTGAAQDCPSLLRSVAQSRG